MHDDERDWLGDWRGIQIEAGSVRQLASDLRTEVYSNLQPHATRLFGRYSPGVAFGAKNPSDDLHAARTKYHECLTGTVDQLAAYINASSILLDAAIEIATRYQTADALAGATVQDIDDAFNNSILVANGPVYGYVPDPDPQSHRHQPRAGGI
jgi:hypothetical protein